MEYPGAEPSESQASDWGIDVKLQDVGFAYDPTQDDARPISTNMSLTIAAGELIAVVGRSGCGKTTLLKLVAGLVSPQSGNVSIGSSSPAEALRARQIAYVFQRPNLLRWKTVIQNVQLPGVLWRDTEVMARAPEALDAVGLGASARQFPDELSVGMQARVAIARAWCQQPRLILLDEPFSALDEVGRDALNAAFVRLWKERGFTALVVTHSIGEAILLADRVMVLKPRPSGLIAEFHVVKERRPREQSFLETVPALVLARAIRRGLCEEGTGPVSRGDSSD